MCLDHARAEHSWANLFFLSLHSHQAFAVLVTLESEQHNLSSAMLTINTMLNTIAWLSSCLDWKQEVYWKYAQCCRLVTNLKRLMEP
jgi:hypothetical protein